MYQMRQKLMSFAIRKGRRNVLTVSTWGRVKKMDQFWADGVHLKESRYFAISEAIVEAAAGLKGKRKGGEAKEAPAKKPRLEANSNRGNSARGQQGGRGRVHGGHGHQM
jgi:hypothetical protein